MGCHALLQWDLSDPRIELISLRLLHWQAGSFTSSTAWEAHGFITHSLYYGEVLSFSTYFIKSFYHKWVLNLVKYFSASTEMITWLLLFFFG